MPLYDMLNKHFYLITLRHVVYWRMTRLVPIIIIMTQIEHRAMGELTPTEYLCVPPHYLETRLCVNCGARYWEYQNVGRHGCRAHPGVLRRIHGSLDMAYSCCGYRPSPLDEAHGCVAADHRDEFGELQDAQQRMTQFREWAVVVVPYALFQFGLEPPCLPEAVALIVHDSRGAPREFTVTLKVLQHQLPMRQVEVARLLLQAMEAHPALAQAVSQRNLRSEARRQASRQAQRVWQREAGRAIDEDPLADVRERFVPYVVIRRVSRLI